MFRDPKIKEYPSGNRGWIFRIANIYKYVKNIVPNAEVYATCPDYPDDYHHKSLWTSESVTNIERTVENVRICTSEFKDVNWLIPVQGWAEDPRSLLRSLEYYRDMGVLDRYRFYAVANLCIERDDDIIVSSLILVRSFFKEIGILDDVKIHVFGMKIQTLRRVKNMIYSFDSTAWSRPVDRIVRMIRNASAKNESERNIFFCEYIKRLKNVYGVHIPDISLETCKKLGALLT